ncbi:unnamed protein product [Rhizophagus irregularis]|nr:unnamed protein product [Rhizophagus irregularis]
MSNSQAVVKSNRTDLTTRTKTKVYCFCKECNGKLVDSRTKTKHGLKYNISYANNNFSNNYQEAEPSNANIIRIPRDPPPPARIPYFKNFYGILKDHNLALRNP